VDVSPTVCEI